MSQSWPANNWFKTEDVVAFYHKEAEAYLHLDVADWKKGVSSEWLPARRI